MPRQQCPCGCDKITQLTPSKGLGEMDGTKMVKKIICGLMLGSFLLLGADDAFVGTWKMNAAKSKFDKGPEAKDFTVVIASEGDTVTVTINGTIGGQTISQKFSQLRAVPSTSLKALLRG
jgi:hypothetical protein